MWTVELLVRAHGCLVLIHSGEAREGGLGTDDRSAKGVYYVLRSRVHKSGCGILKYDDDTHMK